MAKLMFDDGTFLVLEEDGSVAGSDRRFRGAVAVNRNGKTTDTYFTREVTTRPETIPWKFKNGRQKTFVFDGDGNRLEGNYIVVKDE